MCLFLKRGWVFQLLSDVQQTTQDLVALNNKVLLPVIWGLAGLTWVVFLGGVCWSCNILGNFFTHMSFISAGMTRLTGAGQTFLFLHVASPRGQLGLPHIMAASG